MTESGGSELPSLQTLIRFLCAQETRDSKGAAEVAEGIFESLRVHLSSVLGAGGYSTLLARSLALTRIEFPWLAGVAADGSGSISGQLGAAMPEQAAADSARAFCALLTRFASLLETFIGADLTDRLLGAVWQDSEPRTADQPRGGNSYDKSG